jgi:hypothetical protein
MIDYKLISESIDYYENGGFKRIESPWTVSEYIDNITKPNQALNTQKKKRLLKFKKEMLNYQKMVDALLLMLGRYNCR